MLSRDRSKKNGMYFQGLSMELRMMKVTIEEWYGKNENDWHETHVVHFIA